MVEIIRARLAQFETREEKGHRLREFLQLLVLRILHENNHFKNIAFVGGTCLRLIFQSQRFSEDLDFSLTQPRKYDFTKLVKSIELHLEKAGFVAEVTVRRQKTVQRAMVKFIGLLQNLDLAIAPDEKLAIRVEVDSNPPSGWATEMTLLNDLFIFPVWRFDLPSLFATKLHACFFRKYSKGRDFYDLMWYLTRKVAPNLELLNSAIEQAEGRNLRLTSQSLPKFLRARLEGLDYETLQNDVRPFLLSKSEVQLIERDILLGLVKNLGAE